METVPPFVSSYPVHPVHPIRAFALSPLLYILSILSDGHLTMTTAPIGELEFLTKLQRIPNEGLFVASYKYALLLALAELSVEKPIAAHFIPIQV